MSMFIAGVGLAVPEHSITQSDSAAMGVTFATADGSRARTLQALYRRSGVTKRHSVVLDASEGPIEARQSFYPPVVGVGDGGPTTEVRMRAFHEKAPPLMATAGRRALDDAAVSPDEITHLVTVSCTGFFAPGLDAALIHALDLQKTVQRTHVGFMGCHGALNGLRVASAFAGADPDARVLVCSVELCTLHLAYGWDPEQLVANALFADGAAAVVGVPAKAHHVGWKVAASGTMLLPDSSDAMTWRIGDHGFRMTLSADVPDLIQAHVADWLGTWLEARGFSLEDVRHWAVHPGGPRVLTAFGQSIGVPKSALDHSREVLSNYGNMSSATILFILDRLRAAGAEGPCVAVAFGPGLVVEVALLV
jgi:predicted naringenin-chalcone synthase